MGSEQADYEPEQRRSSLRENRGGFSRGRQKSSQAGTLAIDTSVLGAAAHDLLAQAYVWLSIARRLARDYTGAEEAIEKAEEAWRAPRDPRDRRVAAKIFRTKGNLRFHQGRFEQAVDLLSRAVQASRLAGAWRVMAQSLTLRAGVIDYARLGQPTVPDLRQALRLLRDLGEPRLRVGIHMTLTYVYTAAGQPREALKEVAEAWTLWRQLPEAEHDPLLLPQLQWNKGLAKQALGDLDGAETLYWESYAAFHELAEIDHAAIVALDLARLCREKGRPTEVLRLASEALPVLERLKVPEAVEALGLLREALEAETVSAAILEAVRATLVRVQRSGLQCVDPSGPSTLPGDRL